MKLLAFFVMIAVFVRAEPFSGSGEDRAFIPIWVACCLAFNLLIDIWYRAWPRK